ncbi:tetratricopeptide repeat-containing sensor histidine kinase [Sinomicrobium sp. M5D2P9]
MNRNIFSFCLLFYGAFVCFAQTPSLDMSAYADSLDQHLKNTENDSIKAGASFQLINYWLYKDTVKARQYLDQGRALSKNYPYLYAMSYYSEGLFYFNHDEHKSEAAFLKADSLLSRLQTKEAYVSRSNIWNNMAVHRQRNDDDRAHIRILIDKAIPLAKQAGDRATMGAEYLAVGLSFMNMDQYEKAEIYLDKAIDMLKGKRSQLFRLVSAYGRAAENYILLKKYSEARSALDSLHTILAPYPDSEHHSLYYMAEGMYYHETKAYDQALASFNKGIQSADGTNKLYKIQELNFYKVKTLMAAQKYQEARLLLTGFLKEEDMMELYGNRAEIYASLAETYAGLGNTQQAYHWQKQYSTLSDSLHTSKLKNDINALEIKYNNAEKEKRITQLEAEKEMASLSAKNNRLVNWLLGTISLFSFIIIVYSYFYYKKDKKLAFEKEQNYQNQLNKLEQEQQLLSTRAMLKGEEQERKRMAQDLHDGLGGILAGVRMNLSEVESGLTSTFHTEINKIISNVDKSMKELRRIARNLMPESLSRIGLEGALEDLCKSYETASFKVDYQPYEIGVTLTDSERLTIYRIVQELLNNALHHSKASLVIVQCSQNENGFYITVEDDGKGFDPENPKHKKGLGLRNLEHRVKTMDGTLEIISGKNEGTTVNIELYVGG